VAHRLLARENSSLNAAASLRQVRVASIGYHNPVLHRRMEPAAFWAGTGRLRKRRCGLAQPVVALLF